ncbi:O-phosphoseryl-tRNA(Sec) selenium transferase, SepSecS [Popillia japonica]|uniref:O-phosphoseryl-tRNA(Sec) selenium transferase n=1 Tax=Popillia japonica TaxID=7064 RepID=A0AAW1KGD5_POPJA
MLVPSGSSLVTSFDEDVIGRIAKTYPGRASSNSTIDIFITLVSLGKNGYSKFLDDKDCIQQYFQELLGKLVEKYKIFIKNYGSSATSVVLYFNENIDNLSLLEEEILRFVRNVNISLIMTQEDRMVLDHRFEDWGTHGVACTKPFVVFQLSLYTSKDDIDRLLECLDLYLSKFS